MNSLINSHSGFQPLKEVWIGGTYPENFYNNLSSEKQDIFGKITELTNNDLNALLKKLLELGVVVRQPEFNCIEDYLDHEDNLIKPPITPRDWALVLNDTLYIIPQYSSGVEPFESSIKNYLKNNQKVKILNRQEESSDPLVWTPFPSVVRVGRDLYIDYPPNNNNAKLNNEIVISELSKDYRVHVTNSGFHSDGVFCPVALEHIFSTHYKQIYNDTFPGWDVFFLTDTTGQRKNNGFNQNWWLPGHDYPQITSDKLLNFAASWLGDSRETVFEVNMLVIDEHNVICIAEDDAACKKLESLGITPHIVDFKTRGFWDGGIHCITVDICREGHKIDYWPDRGPNGIYRY